MPKRTIRRGAQRAAQAMFERDRASQALGMTIVELRPGPCAAHDARARPDMVNGHGICHGGFVFALADSAFAFACNSHGDTTVAAGATIDFLAPAREGRSAQSAIATEDARRGPTGPASTKSRVRQPARRGGRRYSAVAQPRQMASGD